MNRALSRVTGAPYSSISAASEPRRALETEVLGRPHPILGHGSNLRVEARFFELSTLPLLRNSDYSCTSDATVDRPAACLRRGHRGTISLGPR